MKELPLDGIHYTGADILPSLILSNSSNYANSSIEFKILDLTTDDLPLVDLILCRECLGHLSNRLAGKTLGNIRTSGSEYFLSTTFPAVATNRNIPTGSWRPINLTKPPFDLPQPRQSIDDSDNQPDGLPKAVLGLWRVADIPANRS